MKMKLPIAFVLLAASVIAAGQQPKKLYIAPTYYYHEGRDSEYLEDAAPDKLRKEFAKQCPDLVTVSRFPGSVYQVRKMYYGTSDIFSTTDLTRLDVYDPDAIYTSKAVREKNAVKDICNYLRKHPDEKQ
jgi:hypothetical protein